MYTRIILPIDTYNSLEKKIRKAGRQASVDFYCIYAKKNKYIDLSNIYTKYPP